MVTRIVLVRHGETAWSKEDRFCGISDVPLQEEGVRQARLLAQRLQHISTASAHTAPSTTKRPNPQIVAVYSSPMQRSRRTAQTIAETLGRPVQVVAALRELDYGVWEGLRREDILVQYSEEYAQWARDPAAGRPPQGETGLELLERVRPAIQSLVSAHHGETIVVAGHKTVNRLLICALVGIPPQHYRRAIEQDIACLNVLKIGQNEVHLLVKLNDTCHYRFP